MSKLVIAAGLALAAGFVQAQPAGPAPKGLVVGSGNFYSPVVPNLEEAVTFYRDGIGFQFESEPGNADSTPQLRALFRLPDGHVRWQSGQAPGVPGGIQIIEISSGGQRPDRRIQEPSVVMLLVVVRDIDETFARLEALGAPVVTRSGRPMTIDSAGMRAVIVRDPAGHFVELLQPRPQPRNPAAQPGTGEIRNVLVRHTVEDLDRAVALYRDALGVGGGRVVPTGYLSAPRIVDLLGVPRNTRYRYTTLRVPGSGLSLELIEFNGGRRVLWPNVTIVDVPESGVPDEPIEPQGLWPGATQMQLRVADIDAAAAAIVAAGGTFVSSGGKPIDLPSDDRSLKLGMVRDPDGLSIVLIDTPPQ
jgi:predicted enzyme related to lactoylglutathione lyase